MALRIEDYGLLGDTHTAALVGRDGSIDWLCLPRFDSPACFAALLGGPENGRWLLAPESGVREVKRRYHGDSLVLETEFRTDGGVVRIVDCMPVRRTDPVVVRRVLGVEGAVRMHLELVLRFDYGQVVPWVYRTDGVLRAVAGPDAVHLWSSVPTEGVGLTTRADFVVRAGEEQDFVLVWHPSHLPVPEPVDAEAAVRETEAWWADWAARCTYEGPWRDQVVRSLVVLKAMTYAPTGGIVAAPTTSLPERIGGERNWDYRYCWLRDATFTLYALLVSGYTEEADAWRAWLLRAVGGDPSKMRILYGPAGERRLPESRLDWLAGFEGSRPVRIGNAAADQHQLDVYGELMDALHLERRSGLEVNTQAWAIQVGILDFLGAAWREPDEGIWEVRGPPQHFTHSKVMAWVAFDRAVKAVEQFGNDGPVDRWRALRAEIHADVCSRGYDATRKTFTQAYGSPQLDASLLMMPLVGFLPARDERMRGTVAAVERDLLRDGLVRRYHTHTSDDGLPPGEGAFLACSFWLADNWVLQGRRDEASALFERLLGLTNDLGLLAEEYDPRAGRQLGNFPQAFTHVMLVNTARNLTRAEGPAQHRERT